MTLPKSYKEVLAAGTSDIIAAATHASAQLVLHLVGEQRLSREERDRYKTVLKELLNALRAEQETKP